jgi:ribosome-binding factor A
VNSNSKPLKKASHRVLQVENLVRQCLSEELSRIHKEDALISAMISSVKMTPDLREAKVYVSVWDPSADKTKASSLLQRRASGFREILAKELRTRYIPILKFMPDLKTEKVLKVDQMIASLGEA